MSATLPRMTTKEKILDHLKFLFFASLLVIGCWFLISGGGF